MRSENPRSMVLRMLAPLVLLAIVGLGIGLYHYQSLRTLGSLKKVDEYPLYTMHYYGDYDRNLETARILSRLLNPLGEAAHGGETPAWACSLFAALGDEDSMVFGRNFDWDYSPMVLLFTHPPDGYDSVTIVDIAYLVSTQEVTDLDKVPLIKRSELLQAPFLPFDGMNEHGLAIGMAMVTGSRAPTDPKKESISSLAIMREILDHARTVDEAVTLFKQYNVMWDGGPPVHYLIADATGQAVLVEFDGELVVLPNEGPGWHVGTNFMRNDVTANPERRCWRYGTIYRRLTETQGQLTSAEGLALLEEVAQGSTQWSVIYDMSGGTITIAVDQGYENPHTFRLDLTPN